MEPFAKAVICFHKELHLADLFDRLPKFVFDSKIHFMNTKTETTYIKLKLHINKLVFVKCTLMTYLDQTKMCSLK